MKKSKKKSDAAVTLNSGKSDLAEGFPERLEIVIRKIGSVAETARRLKLAESTIRKWRKGISDPQLQNVIDLSIIANVPIAWLAGSVELDEMSGRTRSIGGAQGEDEYYLVPDFLSEGGKNSCFSFRKDFINQQIGIDDPTCLAMLEVVGDSMDPTIKHGDSVMINTIVNSIKDGLYVLQLGETIAVKRLQILPGDQVSVISDNRSYEPYKLALSDLTKETGDVIVLGQVVWAARKY